jgi:hypothetical protein
LKFTEKFTQSTKPSQGADEIILVSTTVATSLEQTTRTSPASEDSQTSAQEETSSIGPTTAAVETTSIQESTTLSTTLAADSTSTSTSTTESSTTTPAPFDFTNAAPYVLAPMVADPETIAAQADSDFANAMLGIPSSFSAPLVVESADGIYNNSIEII